MADNRNNAEKQKAITSVEVPTSENPENVKDEAFNYDVILDHIGHLGTFQLTTCLWLFVTSLLSGTVVLSYSFTGGIPRFRYTSFLFYHSSSHL